MATPNQLGQMGAQEIRTAIFETAGYGAIRDVRQGAFQPLYADSWRHFATQTANSLTKAWFTLSMNQATGDGGTCYGDSGGPHFLDGVVVSITVTGDRWCKPTDKTYRVDSPVSQAFLAPYLPWRRSRLATGAGSSGDSVERRKPPRRDASRGGAFVTRPVTNGWASRPRRSRAWIPSACDPAQPLPFGTSAHATGEPMMVPSRNKAWGDPKVTHALDTREKEINSRLDTIGWGVVLVIIGLSALAGSTSGWSWFSEHGWMIAVGALFIGINLYRLAVGIPISWFTTILGAFAVSGGVADLTGVDLPIGPAVLIAIGLAIVFSVWRRAEPPAGPTG